MKWLWRYGTEDIGLWKEVIKSKHDELTHWSINVSTDAYGVVLWKSIGKLCQILLGTSHLELPMDLTSNFGRTYGWETQLWVRNFKISTSLQLNQILPYHPTDQITFRTKGSGET